MKEGEQFTSLTKSNNVDLSFQSLFNWAGNDRSDDYISCVADERNR